MAAKIFISYRRDDSAASARHIRDRLAQAFGGSSVFMDVDNLSAGERFDEVLRKALASCNVFLALIGPRWASELWGRAHSMQRDYVREEIAAALAQNMLVIPVLVDRALMPLPEQVPPEIRQLVLHHKHDISHEKFGADIRALIDAIRQGEKRVRRDRSGLGRSLGFSASIAGAVVTTAAVAAFGISYVERSTLPPDKPEKREEATLLPKDWRQAVQGTTQFLLRDVDHRQGNGQNPTSRVFARVAGQLSPVSMAEGQLVPPFPANLVPADSKKDGVKGSEDEQRTSLY